VTITNELIVIGPGRYPPLVLYLFGAASRFLLKTKKRKQKVWHPGVDKYGTASGSDRPDTNKALE
jgi:hypothetical protein